MPTLAIVLWVTVGCLVLSTVTLFVLVCSLRRQLRTCARAVPVQKAFEHQRHDIRRLQLAQDRVARAHHQLSLRIPRPRFDERDTQVTPTVYDARPSWADDDLDTRRPQDGETFLPVDFRHDLW